MGVRYALTFTSSFISPVYPPPTRVKKKRKQKRNNVRYSFFRRQWAHDTIWPLLRLPSPLYIRPPKRGKNKRDQKRNNMSQIFAGNERMIQLHFYFMFGLPCISAPRTRKQRGKKNQDRNSVGQILSSGDLTFTLNAASAAYPFGKKKKRPKCESALQLHRDIIFHPSVYEQPKIKEEGETCGSDYLLMFFRETMFPWHHLPPPLYAPPPQKRKGGGGRQRKMRAQSDFVCSLRANFTYICLNEMKCVCVCACMYAKTNYMDTCTNTYTYIHVQTYILEVICKWSY